MIISVMFMKKKIITYLVFLLFTNLPWILAFFCYSRNCSPWHKKIHNWNDHFQLWNFKLWIHFSYEFFNSSWTILYGLFPDFSYYFFLGFFLLFPDLSWIIFFAVHKIIHTDIKNSFHMSCYISQWHGRDWNFVTMALKGLQFWRATVARANWSFYCSVKLKLTECWRQWHRRITNCNSVVYKGWEVLRWPIGDWRKLPWLIKNYPIWILLKLGSHEVSSSHSMN
jgi:hypothetical protein